MNSYGIDTGQYHFSLANGMVVTKSGDIFVMDLRDEKIVKLHYSASSNTISHIGPDIYSSPYLEFTSSIAYTEMGTPSDVSDDYILVTNLKRRSIVVLTTSGAFVDEITQYWTFSGYKPFKYPANLLVIERESYPIIAITDEVEKTLITGYLRVAYNVLFSLCAPLPHFNWCNIKSLGLDANNYILAADPANKMVHKFDVFGSYICSFNTNLYDVSNISNISRVGPSNTVILDFITYEPWGHENGFARFLPGADICNIKSEILSDRFRFSCQGTDRIIYSIKAVNASNNAVVKDYGTSVNWAQTEITADMLFTEIPTNVRKLSWIITYEPYFNDSYGSYKISQQSQTIKFAESKAYLHLNALLQGFYNGNKMTPDTITVYLVGSNKNTPIYYPEGQSYDVAKAVLDSTGACNLVFSNIGATQASTPALPVFIVIKHRNCVETWSAQPVTIVRDGISFYDFTDSPSKTYGENVIQIGSKYCIYVGDVNQDGYVDPLDLSLVSIDSYNYAAGYLSTDVNGDGYVDPIDMAIVDENSYNYVSIVNPWAWGYGDDEKRLGNSYLKNEFKKKNR